MANDREKPPGRLLALPQTPDAIELRHLRAFVAVAEELNFGRAAGRLYLSQPALSRQISGLERLIGCDLLKRSTHRVELTLAGEALLDRARGLLTDLDDAVSAARSVGGELSGRASRLWAPVAAWNADDGDLEELSAAYEGLLARFSPPPEIQIRPVKAGGVPSLLLTDEPERPATVLYLHGGAYVMGSAYGYRPLAGALSAAVESGVLVPDYRLAPEHPFPAAVDDALQAYLWLLDQGTDPRRITISGDSSGAGLAVSLILRIKRQKLPLPGCIVLLCPWVDLAYTLPEKLPDDPQLAILGELMRQCVDRYLAGHPPNDPIVNPLGFAEELSGIPPMLIQAGTGDHVLPQAEHLADRARQNGVDVTLELYPVATHGFHLFWSFLPEAQQAIEQAARFITAATDTRDAAASG